MIFSDCNLPSRAGGAVEGEAARRRRGRSERGTGAAAIQEEFPTRRLGRGRGHHSSWQRFRFLHCISHRLPLQLGQSCPVTTNRLTFSQVGFMLLMCFCHTIAARYGALAGFGLSLAKWTLIVKRNTDLVRDENAWLWWLVLAFGFLICIRCRRIPMVVFSIVQTKTCFSGQWFNSVKSSAPGRISRRKQGSGSSSSTEKKLFCAFGQDSSRFLVFVNSLRIRSKRKELEIIRMLPPPTKHSPIVCIFCQN